MAAGVDGVVHATPEVGLQSTRLFFPLNQKKTQQYSIIQLVINCLLKVDYVVLPAKTKATVLKLLFVHKIILILRGNTRAMCILFS